MSHGGGGLGSLRLAVRVSRIRKLPTAAIVLDSLSLWGFNRRGIRFVVTEDGSGGGCCSRLTGPDAEPGSEYPLRLGGNGAHTNRGIPSGRGYCGSPGIRLFNMSPHTLIRKCGFLTESVGCQYNNMSHNPDINTEFNAYFTNNDF